MKKISVILTLSAILFILGACDSGDTDTGDNQNDAGATTDDQNENEETAEDKIYQVGETAVVTSDLYDFDYEITVNDYEITNSSEKYDMNEFYQGFEEDSEGKYIAIVNVTIKNITDQTYVPNRMFSANLSQIGQEAGDTSVDDYFPEVEEDLAPGDSITGDIIYHVTISEGDDIEGYWFKYEVMSDEETVWELPNTVK